MLGVILLSVVMLNVVALLFAYSYQRLHNTSYNDIQCSIKIVTFIIKDTAYQHYLVLLA